MSQDQERDPKVDRRNFLKVVGVAGAAGALPAGPALAKTDHSQMAMPAPQAGAVKSGTALPPGYEFFNPDEAAFVEAAVDTLIPADEVGPGALESGVAVYIDRQMAGAYGCGYRMYLEGPFGEGTPSQGWQLQMTPAELIRAGIADVNAYVAAKHSGNSFAGLAPDQRKAVLTEVDQGKAELKIVPPAFFFNQFINLVMEGYFGDPIYGGNKNKAVWKMIGFPGVGAMYMDKIEPYRNKPYTVDPSSIQDFS